MPKSSYVQSSFLGGEWAPEMQGRSDMNGWKAAMNRCLNYFPIEQGSLLRRSGFRRLGTTRFGMPARLEEFDLSGNQVVLEFTNDGAAGLSDVGHVRLIQGDSYYPNGTAEVSSISAANPAVVTTAAAHGFSTGDVIFFTFDYAGAGDAAPDVGLLANAQFLITKISNTTFSLQYAFSPFNNVNGATLGWTGPVSPSAHYIVTRITELVSPYIANASHTSTNGEWEYLNFTQDETTLYMLHPRFAPRTLTGVATGTAFSALATLAFLDGPYLDINTTSTTLTPSAISGSVTITASSTTGINSGSGFVSTDVGRHIRMYSQPAPWDRTSNAYVVGSVVMYTDGNAYVALKNDNGPAANGGVAAAPGNIDHWSLVGNPSTWCWLIITAVSDTTHVTATIQTSTQSANASMYNALATATWQLGLYSDTTGWPTVGTFHEDRLWLSGVLPNRLDGSMTGAYATFSPTADDGTVGDANGVAAVAKTGENNQVLWLTPDDSGLMFGTISSEWTVRASALDDPITPSSIQVRQITTFGGSPGYPDPDAGTGSHDLADFTGTGIAPLRPLRMHVFTQRMQRKLIEIGRPGVMNGSLWTPIETNNLSLTASHLSVSGIAEIVYVQEPKPVIWARLRNGRLIGCSYIRNSQSVQAGWHQHYLGTGAISAGGVDYSRKFTSICAAPSPDQLSDRLYAVVSGDTPSTAAPVLNYPIIQRYDNTAGLNFGDWLLIPDSANNRLFGFREGNRDQAAAGVYKFDATTGAQTGVILASTMFSGDAFNFSYVNPPMNITYGGAIVWSPARAIPGAGFAMVNGSTMALSARLDSANQALVNVPQSLAVASVAGTDFVIGTSSGGGSPSIFVLEAHGTTLQFAGHQFDTDEDSAWAGSTVAASGIVYTLAVPGNIGIYKTTLTSGAAGYNIADWPGSPNSHIATTKLGTIAPSAIDAGWTSAAVTDPIYDASDGNIIFFATSSGGSADRYMVKASTTDASIVWSVAVSVHGSAMGLNGTLWIADERFLYEFDTSTGALTSTTTFSAANGILATHSNYDPASRSIWGQVVYSGTETPPPYPASGTAPNSNNEWGRFILQPPSPPAEESCHFVERLADVFDDSIADTSGCFVDDAFVPASAKLCTTAVEGFDGLRVYGALTYDGIFCATVNGLDIGPFWPDHAVQTSGHVDFPYTGEFTLAFMQALPLSAQATPYEVPVDANDSSGHYYHADIVVGYIPWAQGQLLRPDHAGDAGTRQGPAFGKIRRNHWYAALLNRTQNIEFGTDFTRMYPAVLPKADGITPISATALFTGTITDTVDDDYGFDGMLAWQQRRPTPGRIDSVGGFIMTQEK